MTKTWRDNPNIWADRDGSALRVALRLLREAHRGDWGQLPGEVWNQIDTLLAALPPSAPPALDVERLAEAYHRYRLQFPAGTLYCGTDPDGPEYPPQPYEFDSAPCSCHMDMVGTVQRMEPAP